MQKKNHDLINITVEEFPTLLETFLKQLKSNGFVENYKIDINNREAQVNFTEKAINEKQLITDETVDPVEELENIITKGIFTNLKNIVKDAFPDMDTAKVDNSVIHLLTFSTAMRGNLAVLINW